MVTGMILTILSIPVTGIKLVKKLFAFSSVLFFSMHDVNAGEKEVNAAWCNKNDGEIEYRTRYGSYVDCLLEEYAVESEYDYKWKEGVGQSLHYAESTGKKAAILFIRRAKTKKDFMSELKKTIEYHELPITIFEVYER